MFVRLCVSLRLCVRVFLSTGEDRWLCLCVFVCKCACLCVCSWALEKYYTSQPPQRLEWFILGVRWVLDSLSLTSWLLSQSHGIWKLYEAFSLRILLSIVLLTAKPIAELIANSNACLVAKPIAWLIAWLIMWGLTFGLQDILWGWTYLRLLQESVGKH